jgi:two-component system phosphate regulon response regulator PhoB
MKERILVVDDEPDIVEMLEYNLRQAGYAVATASTGEGALGEIRAARPDLVLLDVMLPDVAGTEVCRRIRRDPATASMPIVMITARNEEIDRVVGLELGADDYVAKPFSVRELVLRVGAILRRSTPPRAKAAPGERLVVGLLEIDVPAHRVFVRGDEIPLTALEFKLLHDLASRAGRVQSREGLLERVWGYAPGIETRTVDTHVRRLREKLGDARDQLETIRSIGYRMNEK